MEMVKTVLEKANRVIVGCMRFVVVAVSLSIVGAMWTQSVLRYVFQHGIFGLDEVAGLAAIWLYLMGAAYGTYERSHIKTGVMETYVKRGQILRIARVGVAGISCVVASFMAKWSYDYLVWSISTNMATTTYRWPMAFFQFPIFLGAVLMSIYFLVEMLDAVIKGEE